jgi:hypothetical protein
VASAIATNLQVAMAPGTVTLAQILAAATAAKAGRAAVER